jgi:hypothetical protein
MLDAVSAPFLATIRQSAAGRTGAGDDPAERATWSTLREPALGSRYGAARPRVDLPPARPPKERRCLARINGLRLMQVPRPSVAPENPVSPRPLIVHDEP